MVAATTYRDLLIRSNRPLSKPVYCAILKKTNRSGVSGLSRIDQWEFSKGRRVHRLYWDVQWPIENCQSRHKKFSIVVRPEVRKWIVDKSCRDRSYGARPLRRAIQRYLEDPLKALIRNRLEPDVTLEIYLDGDTLCYLPAGSPAESGMRLSV